MNDEPKTTTDDGEADPASVSRASACSADGPTVREKVDRRLRGIGATDGERLFLLGCGLPQSLDDVDEWCDECLDDLRRSQ